MKRLLNLGGIKNANWLSIGHLGGCNSQLVKIPIAVECGDAREKQQPLLPAIYNTERASIFKIMVLLCTTYLTLHYYIQHTLSYHHQH